MYPNLTLREVQSRLTHLLVNGPDRLCDDVFHGAPLAIIRGLKAHANTISHARLVALEETFPQTRELMGHEAFNLLSRKFLDAGHGSNASLDRLGQDFFYWLERENRTALEIALARFEGAWLETYAAKDAPALGPADLECISEAELLAMMTQQHPAARVLRDEHGLGDWLGLAGASPWLVIARPAGDVLVHRAEEIVIALFCNFAQETPMGGALEVFMTRHPHANIVAAMQELFAMGVLMRKASQCSH